MNQALREPRPSSARDGSDEPVVEQPVGQVDFNVTPDRYRHWKVEIDGRIATVSMCVDAQGGLHPGYVLKLNSYDLGVDIELYDIIQRLRFEHPEVAAVVLTGGIDKVFCAGANIQMLAQSSHQLKVNFCKFTNETRSAMEQASRESGQTWICALNGTASGGGYELALATEHILLIDDGSSVVSLPEIPLLGVLPGTGGLTRVVEKRRVRRDLADYFATKAEGIKGEQARRLRLVDEVVPRSRFSEAVRSRAEQYVGQSPRPAATGITLTPLEITADDNGRRYPHISAGYDRRLRTVTISISGPEGEQPATAAAVAELGVEFWPLALSRELDELLLHLRLNEPQLGTLLFETSGSLEAVLAIDNFLLANRDDWLINEIVLFWGRTLKRVDLTSRSIFALIKPGSCFAGTLLELVLAADRGYMLDDPEADPGARVMLTEMNFGPVPMSTGQTRIQTRLLGEPDLAEDLRRRAGDLLEPADAVTLGLVTFAPDDLDWEDEIRLAIEERGNLSPDALTGMEANFRFCGSETTETKIFGRLTAWQNWIFQRPNASGPDGALKSYGSGHRPSFDRGRV
jgi:benzoyl-CoA-dihydrodiol lyase